MHYFFVLKLFYRDADTRNKDMHHILKKCQEPKVRRKSDHDHIHWRLISGLDTNGIIDQMLAIQQRPIERLQNKGSEYQIQLSTYGTLKGLVSSLQSAVSAIDTEGGLASYTATSGDKDLFTVTSGDDAAVGSYDVTVQQLAKVHKLTSTAFAAEEAMGEGTIHLKVGTARNRYRSFSHRYL